MNQVMTLGCTSKKIMDTYQVQIFCMNTWDHCCLIYHKKKLLIKYHYIEQKIVRQMLWCKKKSFRIFDIAMSKKHRLYFLLCQDWFIYFLNFEFQVVNKVQLECKQFTNLLFLDHLSTFVMVQFSLISTFEVSMKEKFKIVNYCELEGSLEWNRQCKQVDCYFLLYNSQNISIYDLRTIKHLGLIKVGLTISDVYYVNDLLYAGDIYGTIWCYDLNGTLQYFHEHAHDGQIVSMTVYKEELFTVANDLCINVWKLENLVFCQSYPIYQQQIQYFKFINYSKYFVQSVDQLFICELNHILMAYHLHNSSISAMSNLCIAFKNHVYYSNSTHKVLFAPNSVNQVLQIIDSPSEPQTYYLHLSNQVLAKWVNNQQVSQINFDKIRTINGDKINQDVTFVQFMNTKPPIYDVELTIDSKDMKRLTLNNSDNQQFITLGCSKGAVLIVPENQFTIIYTRINYNKSAISDITLFNDQLVVKSKDDVINFIKFEATKTKLIQSIKISKLGPIHVCQWNNLAVAQSNELFVFNTELISYNTNSGHETDIQMITSNKEYIVSNSIQQLKVWNQKGFCLITINFHVQIDFIHYLIDDLIISANGGLCQMPIPQCEETVIDFKEFTQIKMADLITQLRRKSLKSNNEEIKTEKQEIKVEKQITFQPELQQIQLPQIRLKRIDQKINQRSQIIKTPPRNNSQITQLQSYSVKNSVSKSLVPQSIDYSIQHTADSSCVLPAIPRQSEDDSLLNRFLNKRTKKGVPRNRREWTLEKKIIGNILSLI